MTSRADELAEAVLTFFNTGMRFTDDLLEALHRYRNSAPSEETHERVRMRVTEAANGDRWGNPDHYTALGRSERVLGYVTFYLPKPAPVPEIDDVEVELG